MRSHYFSEQFHYRLNYALDLCRCRMHLSHALTVSFRNPFESVKKPHKQLNIMRFTIAKATA